MLVAQEHLAAPARPWRRNPWAWAVALAAHLLVIALVLLMKSKPPGEDLQNPPGVSVVFDAGGAPQTTAPPNSQPGPPQTAQAPPPPPPPPAPSAPSDQEEVQVPDYPLSTVTGPPPAPQPQPSQLPRPAPRPRARPAPRYAIMNGMSFGNSAAVAPPAPNAPHGMNFSLPTSDAQAATSSDLSVHGDAGSDWSAALSRWVEEHAYYPQAAAEQGQQGTAEVRFTVDRQGHVTGLRLITSAGSVFLDQAWEQLFADNDLPPFPADAKDDHVEVDYTVHYQLIH